MADHLDFPLKNDSVGVERVFVSLFGLRVETEGEPLGDFLLAGHIELGELLDDALDFLEILLQVGPVDVGCPLKDPACFLQLPLEPLYFFR